MLFYVIFLFYISYNILWKFILKSILILCILILITG